MAISRSRLGLKNFFLPGTKEFDTGDWEGTTGIGFSLSGSNLAVAPIGSNVWQAFREAAAADSNGVYIACRMQRNTTQGCDYGPGIVQDVETASLDSSGSQHVGNGGAPANGGFAGPMEFVAGVRSTHGSGSNNLSRSLQHNLFIRVGLDVDPPPALVRANSTTIANTGPYSRQLSGKPGFVMFNISSAVNWIFFWWYSMLDSIIRVEGLEPGQKANVRTSGGAKRFTDATADGSGVAIIDTYGDTTPLASYDLAVYESDGTTLVEAFHPTDGHGVVWGGDIYVGPDPDVIEAENVVPGVIEIRRIIPGDEGESFIVERDIGSGFVQISDSIDAGELIFHDEGFDPFGVDPTYRTNLDGLLSNEVEVELLPFVGPNKPTISILEEDGQPIILDDSVGLASGPYSDSLSRDQFGADFQVRNAAGTVIRTERVARLSDVDTTWANQILDGLSPPEATLYGYVRHLASDPLYGDLPVPGEWSDPVEFTLVEEIDEEEVEEPAETIIISKAWKSEYPFGTSHVTFVAPAFDGNKAGCAGPVPWFGIVYVLDNGRAIVRPGDLRVNTTFIPPLSMVGGKITWIYRCNGGTGLLRSYRESFVAQTGTGFAPETPPIFETALTSPGEPVTSDLFTFRWNERSGEPVFGASVSQDNFDGGVFDWAHVKDNSEIVYDNLGLRYGKYNFGGTYSIQVVHSNGTAVKDFGSFSFGHRYWYEHPVLGTGWLPRIWGYEFIPGTYVLDGWEKVLNLSDIPDGAFNVRLVLDGRTARVSHPFQLDRSSRTTFLQGTDLRMADLTVAGSEEVIWEDTDEGVRTTSPANVSSWAALGLTGAPRVVEIITTGSWSTRKNRTDDWGFFFLPDAESGWGPAGYLNAEAGYSGIVGLMKGSGPAWGRNSIVGQGAGGSSGSWWFNGPRFGRGVGISYTKLIGPRNPSIDGEYRGSGSFQQWNQAGEGLGSQVSSPLRPVYSQRLRLELVSTNLDGTHNVRATHFIHGPGNDSNYGPRFDRHFFGVTWDCGFCGLFVESLGDHGWADGVVVDFYSLSIRAESFGDCVPPPGLPEDVIPGKPCMLELTKFEEDRITPAWVLTTSPNPAHGEPFLMNPRHYGEQIIDFITGSARTSQVSIEVIDWWAKEVGQFAGVMTARLADMFGVSAIKGYRLQLRRWISEVAGWITVGDGPGGSPRQSDYPKYELSIRDSREWERKLPLVSSPNTSLLPAGPTNGFGSYGEELLVEPSGYITGTFKTDPSPGIGGALVMDSHWDPAPFTDPEFDKKVWLRGASPISEVVDPETGLLQVPFDGAVASRMFSNRIEDAGIGDYVMCNPFVIHGPYVCEIQEAGVQLWTHYWDKILIKWRKVGDTEWKYERPTVTLPKSDPLSLLIGTGFLASGPVGVWNGTVIDSDPAVESVGLYMFPMQRRWGYGTPDELVDNDEVEFAFLWLGEISPETPAYIEGQTFGEFAKDVYDGLYAPRDENGNIVPTGIRYNEADLLLMTNPVKARLIEPISDSRDFLEKEGYSAIGYAPAFNNHLEISPKSDDIPEDPEVLQSLLVLDNSIVIPEPSWAHGAKIVNVLDFTFDQVYPDQSSEAIDGLIVQKITIQRKNWQSIYRNGEQKHSIATTLFVALSQNGTDTLEVPYARELAENRRVNLFNRLRYGTPTFQLSAFRIATFDARTGDFVRVRISWMPNYSTQMRHMDILAQALGIADLDCNLRRFTLESCGPWPLES